MRHNHDPTRLRYSGLGKWEGLLASLHAATPYPHLAHISDAIATRVDDEVGVKGGRLFINKEGVRETKSER